MDLSILYQDDQLVAIDKPPGLLVHRSPFDPETERFAVQLLRDQIGRRVHPCHRLDKANSGALLFALDTETLTAMQRQFAEGAVAKEYRAVVRGWTDAEGVIDYPLRYEPSGRGDHGPSDPQDAVTRYRRLATCELPFPSGGFDTSRYSLVSVEPETGRKHQIRRHMAHLRHPVVGDTTHGDGHHNRLFREHFSCHRLLLAAVRLAFEHPASGERCTIETGPGDEFEEVLEKTGLRTADDRSGRNH